MKKTTLISGTFAVITFIANQLSTAWFPRLTDFINFILFIGLLIFLPLLFIIKASRISQYPKQRKAFQIARYGVLVGIALFLSAILIPRSYGVTPLKERPGTQYWDLPTGSRIAYTLIPGKLPKKLSPIISLHGGPGGSFGDGSIKALLPFSEDGYDIYLYDQLGGGLSSRLEDITGYTADRHKKDLEEIVKKIGAQKVILLGHSWGAILAVLYTADNPGKVEKLILTGPGPIMPAHRDLAKLKAPDSLHLREPYYSNRQGNELANNIRTRAMAFFALNFGKKLASDKEADDFAGYLGSLVDRSTVCDTARVREMKVGPGAGFYCQVMTVKSFGQVQDPRPKIKGLPIPVLVMKGQCDNQKWGFTHEYLDLFPNHRLVIVPDAGHSISAEQPALFLTTIRDFLKE